MLMPMATKTCSAALKVTQLMQRVLAAMESLTCAPDPSATLHDKSSWKSRCFCLLYRLIAPEFSGMFQRTHFLEQHVSINVYTSAVDVASATEVASTLMCCMSAAWVCWMVLECAVKVAFWMIVASVTEIIPAAASSSSWISFCQTSPLQPL